MKYPIIFGSIFSLLSQQLHSVELGKCNFARHLQIQPDQLINFTTTQNFSSSHYIRESSALLFQRGRYETIPELALEYSFDSKNGEAFVTLNPDCRWSDGEAITSENFIDSFRILFDPSNDAYIPGRDVFKNGYEVWKGDLPFEDLGIQAINDSVIKFDFNAPESLFLAMMSSVNFTPAPSHILKENPNYWDNYMDVSVVSGPYTPIEDNEEETIFVPNPYYCSTSRQNFDHVKIYKTTTEAEAGNLIYESKVDIAGRLPARQVKVLSNLDNVLNDFEIIDVNDEVIYLFNVNSKIITEPKIRQALGSVLDYDYLESNTLGYSIEKADSFAFRYPGYNPPRVNQNLPDYGQRIEAAKKILNDFGYTDENPLKLRYKASKADIYVYLGQAVSSMLNQLPVEVTKYDVDNKAQSDPNDIGPEITLVAWGSDYSDPEDFLTYMVNKYSTETGKAKMQDLLTRANSSETPEKRFALLEEVEVELAKDQTVFPVTWLNTLWFVNKDLEHRDEFYFLARNFSRKDCTPLHLDTT